MTFDEVQDSRCPSHFYTAHEWKATMTINKNDYPRTMFLCWPNAPKKIKLLLYVIWLRQQKSERRRLKSINLWRQPITLRPTPKIGKACASLGSSSRKSRLCNHHNNEWRQERRPVVIKKGFLYETAVYENYGILRRYITLLRCWVPDCICCSR